MHRAAVCLFLALSVSCRGTPTRELGTTAREEPSARSQPLMKGDLAVDFSALSQTGYTVTLTQFLDKPVAVYFCLDGLDASCSALSTALRDRWLALNQRLGMVLFVLPSGYSENLRASAEAELPFLLLADLTGAIAHSYGLATPDTAIRRIAFLIGPDRKVLSTFNDPTGPAHVDDLVRALGQ